MFCLVSLYQPRLILPATHPISPSALTGAFAVIASGSHLLGQLFSGSSVHRVSVGYGLKRNLLKCEILLIP